MHELTDTALIAEREKVKAEFAHESPAQAIDMLAHEVVTLRRKVIEARRQLHERAAELEGACGPAGRFWEGKDAGENGA
jgi:hypothetical protein